MFSLLCEVLLEMKRNREKREGSRLESYQYFSSTVRVGFVQDLHQISTNH